MKAVAGVVRAPLRLLGLIPKKPPAPAPQKPVMRDDARDAAGRDELLRTRRGARADMVTGSGGAEAGRGGATRLG